MKLHSLTACFLILDIGVLILNRYILLDPILVFFISGSFFSMSQFRTIQEPFTTPWWTWLTVTGAMLAGAISVKFVGLFIVLYVGIFTIGQLWGILGDLSQPFLCIIKHFLARSA